MKITVAGTGYVGLVSGVCLAAKGHDVVCIDLDQDKVDKINRGEPPIYEEGLEELLKSNIGTRLRASTNLHEAVVNSDVSLIAVGTPFDGSAIDVSYIRQVSREIGAALRDRDDYHMVVVKSTVVPGTTDEVVLPILESESNKKAGVQFGVGMNPEFLREGVAVDDFLRPDRVVIGTDSEKAKKVMERLYNPFVRSGNPIYFMDERSAEMTKYAANSYLATRISYMNEIANLCEIVGADVDNVRKGMGSDSRIGKRFLFPGVGYGGSCFPKDVQALAKTAADNDYDFKILKSVMNVNDLQKHVLSEKIIEHYGGSLAGKTVAIWGLAFKPNTDDIREAPALYIINDLIKAGATIKAFDPEAMGHVKAEYNGQVHMAADQYEALIGADCLAIVTEWSVFRTPSFSVMKELLKEPIIFDGRNLYDLANMEDLGFHYNSIGRGVVNEGEMA